MCNNDDGDFGGVACGAGLTDVIGHFGTVAGHGTCEAQINYCTTDSDCGLGYGRAAACEYIGSVQTTTSGNCGACWATASSSSPPPEPPSPPSTGECCSVCASDGGVACGEGLTDVIGHFGTVAEHGTCEAQINYCTSDSDCGLGYGRAAACEYIGSVSSTTSGNCGACWATASSSSPPPEPPSPPSTGECCSVCASDGGVACGEGLTDVIGHFGTVAEHGTCEAQINYCTSDSDCGLGYGRAAACEYIGSVSSTTSGNCGACWATG